MRSKAIADEQQQAEPGDTAQSGTQPTRVRLVSLLASRQFRFLLVGGVNTALGLALFVVVQSLFGSTIGYMASLVISYAIAILCSFALQRRFVFQVRSRVMLDLGRFTLVNLTGLALNAVLLPFFVEIVKLSPVPAQIFSLAIVLVFNYFGHSLFSFRR